MHLVRLCVVVLAVLASASVATTTQAMYDPGTGKFLQRDPGRVAPAGGVLIPRPGDGYQDGMNLTAGHFAMHGALDPTGRNVVIDSFSYNEVDARGDTTNRHQLPDIPAGNFTFSDWGYRLTLSGLPDDAWSIQENKMHFQMMDMNGDLVAEVSRHLYDVIQLDPINGVRTIGDTRSGVNDILQTVFNMGNRTGEVVGKPCDTFTYTEENSLGIYRGVELLVGDEWTRDDIQDHMVNGTSMIFTESRVEFHHMHDLDIIDEFDVSAVRGIGEPLWGPNEWTVDVAGHIDEQGNVVIDRAIIDFSSFGQDGLEIPDGQDLRHAPIEPGEE